MKNLLFRYIFIFSLSWTIISFTEKSYGLQLVNSSGDIKIIVNKSADSVFVQINNLRHDTLYLLDSYFTQKDCISIKYLHYISKKNRSYNINFSPIVYYLGGKASDRAVFGDERAVNQAGFSYHFIYLAPGEKYNLKFAFSDLFKNEWEAKNAVSASGIMCNDKFCKPKFHFLTTKVLKGFYRLSIEFACYKQVNLLTNLNAYYLDEFSYNKQAVSYKAINVPIQEIQPTVRSLH